MLSPITDGELRVLDVLWTESPLPAAQIAKRLNASCGWSKNTTYTFITRLVEKDVVRRTDPGFLCAPLYTRAEIGVSEGRSFLNKLFGGSLGLMVASFVKSRDLSDNEIIELRRMIDESAGECHE